MSTLKTPFRYDFVCDVVVKQKAAGFHDITDGEVRRKFWHLDFMWGIEGVAHEKEVWG